MCRLLGWAASSPQTLAGLLGEEDLDAFTSLSRKHGDGWGVAWSTVDDLAVRRGVEPAYASPDFAEWAYAEPHDLGLVHLRWATLGLPVRPENTHPFTDGGSAFAHNGSIRPPSSLDELLTPEMRRATAGDTDSERYFRAVLSRAGDDGPLEEGLAGTVDHIARTRHFSSLNCLLLTPDTLYAACRFDPEHNEREPDYFHLRYRVTDDAVVVASTGWGSDWQPLANGELLTVRRETLEVSVTSLADALIGS